jgi:hypothetical protein
MWSLVSWIFLWLALSAVVAIAASQQGRSALGWFALAVFISPLFAGLLVRAMQKATDFMGIMRIPEPFLPPVRSFESEGAYGDVPYKVNDSGTIDAIVAGQLVRFSNVDQFLAAAQFDCGVANGVLEQSDRRAVGENRLGHSRYYLTAFTRRSVRPQRRIETLLHTPERRTPGEREPTATA